jgi:hypothetical protein
MGSRGPRSPGRNRTTAVGWAPEDYVHRRTWWPEYRISLLARCQITTMPRSIDSAMRIDSRILFVRESIYSSVKRVCAATSARCFRIFRHSVSRLPFRQWIADDGGGEHVPCFLLANRQIPRSLTDCGTTRSRRPLAPADYNDQRRVGRGRSVAGPFPDTWENSLDPV